MILFVSVWPKVVSIAGGFGIFIMDSWMVLKFKDPFAMLT
ncbi:putative membrane protein [Helicobacter pylori R046Wa]|nr:putative membrane protein [Helicobacter pylori R046Wa]